MPDRRTQARRGGARPSLTRRSRGRSRTRRAATTALTFVLLLAAGVAGVAGFLELRPRAATEACIAVLPDGASHTLDAAQADNAALLAAVGGRRELPARAVTIALATALQESKLTNIDYGDRDSVGLFQQRPSQGWGTVEQILDPVYSTNAFYDSLVRIPGYEDLEITVAAQEVQRSAYPEAYARHEPRARAFASALSGHSPAALTCDLGPLDDEASPTGPVTARLARDWGAVPRADLGEAAGGAVVIDATAALSAAPAAQAGWSIGQWAVATASTTGVSYVVVGDRMWERGMEGWSPAGEMAQPEGFVLVG